VERKKRGKNDRGLGSKKRKFTEKGREEKMETKEEEG